MDKVDSKAIFKEVISDSIKPAFKKVNFKTAGTTFLKDESSFVKVFNIQSSVYNSAADLSFTFNIGFFFPYSNKVFTIVPEPKALKEKDCQIRIRSGYLTNDGKDYWYKINGQTELNNLKTQIDNHIRTIIAFFEQYNAITDIIALKGLKHIMAARVEFDIAIALMEQGNVEEGQRFFNNYYQSYKGSDSWIKKIEQFAEQRGIKLESRV